jgi:AAA-like domain
MAKKFNVTGRCIPALHYMADRSVKMNKIIEMVEDGDYFVINRPRQYGKTTTLHHIAEALIDAGLYVGFNISFEGIGDVIFETEEAFVPGFVRVLSTNAKTYAPDLVQWLKAAVPTVNTLEDLSDFITALADKVGKKMILIIDEVDKSSNNQLFVSFLAMLRDKYLVRDKVKTFHSVVLAGVHDVKSLKLKINPNSTFKYNSPWNIAEEFNVDMNFSIPEIQSMLEEYVKEKGVKMDTAQIAERLFYFTSGYPYLVSSLCKIIAEEILPKKAPKSNKEWTIEDANDAFHAILRKANNANFDTLMKNLEDYTDLYNLVFAVIFNGERMEYRADNPTISLGTLHGIFAASPEGMLKIHSRIYRERIANMMISKWRTANLGQHNSSTDVFDYTSQYRLPNQGLNMQKVLENFQTFMKKEYNTRDRKFLERDGRLIFLAFMRPILNGAGYDFKEPQVSEEKRLDVVITYYQHQYVAELKLWYGPAANAEGLLQLADYLDRTGLDTGYLIIFDHSQRKLWEKDWVDVGDKRIFWVKV